MKVISYSLWGNNPKYWVGALINAYQARDFYPDWVCRFYVDFSLPSSFYDLLRSTQADVMQGRMDMPGLYWRFLVADDHEVERFIVRDTDSRFTMREVAAVQAWMESKYRVHSMRDHPAHARPFNGGMWGAVQGVCPPMADAILKWISDYRESVWNYGRDQDFLTRLWPLLKSETLQHDAFSRNEYEGSLPFPQQRIGHRFVGEVFNEYNQPREKDWEAIPPDS